MHKFIAHQCFGRKTWYQRQQHVRRVKNKEVSCLFSNDLNYMAAPFDFKSKSSSIETKEWDNWIETELKIDLLVWDVRQSHCNHWYQIKDQLISILPSFEHRSFLQRHIRMVDINLGIALHVLHPRKHEQSGSDRSDIMHFARRYVNCNTVGFFRLLYSKSKTIQKSQKKNRTEVAQWEVFEFTENPTCIFLSVADKLIKKNINTFSSNASGFSHNPLFLVNQETLLWKFTIVHALIARELEKMQMLQDFLWTFPHYHLWFLLYLVASSLPNVHVQCSSGIKAPRRKIARLINLWELGWV